MDTSRYLSPSYRQIPPSTTDQSTHTKMSEKVTPSSLKSTLLQSLRENGNTYWIILKQFMNSKIGKSEFHQQLKKLLKTKELVNLHNAFLQTIINNAYASYNATKGRKLVTKHGIRSTPYRRRSIIDPYSKLDYKYLPESAIILKRMQRSATQHGLASVSPDASALMIVALQQYLIRTLGNIKSEVIKSYPIDDLDHGEEALPTTIPGDISPSDIERASIRVPNLFCDTHSLLQNKFNVDIE